MKKMVFLLVSFLIFSVLNFLIYQKENVLKTGRTILIKLAPVDPRSLMQGDYMRLRYDLANKIERSSAENEDIKGKIVVKLDSNDVAIFVRFYKDESLNRDEYLLVYKRIKNSIQIGAESFFFQEGHAKYYDSAQYGELKVTESGKSVLFGLRDKNFKPL